MSEPMTIKSSYVKKAAARAGFDACGIVEICNLDAELPFTEKWLKKGFDGGLDYMHRNLDKRFSPRLLADGARSIVVCAVSYKNDTSLGYPEGNTAPKVASYARAADYHEIIKGMLRRLAAELESEYGGIGWRAFCDSAPVLEKRWAARAGIGWQGRNSLIINPELGSFFLLGELLIDAEVDIYDEPYDGPGCAGCGRCAERCPNSAIMPDNCVDARKCIARATIEKFYGEKDAVGENTEGSIANEIMDTGRRTGGEIPLNGWIFGCDECQSVCPYNAAAPSYRNPAFEPLFDPGDLDREFWLSLSEDGFREKFGNTAIYRTGLARLKKNIGE